MVSQSSTSSSTNNVLPVQSQQVQSQQPQSTKQTDGVLISGLMFLIIGIVIVVVGWVHDYHKHTYQ